ncbi:MAG: transglutaminase-like domain-containing protein [Planctomycetota bacterium]
MEPSDDPASFMSPTRVIDSDAPVIRETAASIVEGLESDIERAVAIHDFVRDEIDFGWQVSFYESRASEVLQAGIGYCNTKSTLFIALLRSQGIPARHMFVDLDSKLLAGVVNPGTPYVDHSYAEVYLNGEWIRTDSYVVDRPLFDAAQKRLEAEGRLIGYGVHANGTIDWSGTADAFSQFVDDGSSPHFTTRSYGIHSDVISFYRDEPDTWNELSLGMRVLMRVAAPQANRAADRLRTEGG